MTGAIVEACPECGGSGEVFSPFVSKAAIVHGTTMIVCGTCRGTGRARYVDKAKRSAALSELAALDGETME